MGRAIAGVIAGYIAMFVIVFVLLTLGYLAMGAERAFQPGTYEVSGAWLAVMFLVNSIAALAGGFVCVLIAPSSKAPVALAVVIIVLGVLMSIPVFMGPPEGAPTVRDGSVGNMEAMMNARQPGWVALLNVVVGAAGVMIGARLKKPTAAAQPIT
jgi:hypothetical protein